MALEASPAFQQQLTYSAEITRRAIMCRYQRGVSGQGTVAGGLVHPADLQITYSGSGLGVNVGSGEAIVPGSSTSSQSGYYVANNGVIALSPAAANPSLPRIDLVCLTIADAAYSGTSNVPICQIVTGTPTAGATTTNLAGAPNSPASSLALGYVQIPNAAATINSSNISNTAVQVSNLQAPSYTAARVYYSSGSVASSNSVAAQVAFNSENFDLGGNFDNVTNFRYNVPIAGVYAVSTGLNVGWTNIPQGFALLLYKNGAQYSVLADITLRAGYNGGDLLTLQGSDVVKCVAGDYLSVYFLNSASVSASPVTGSSVTFMSVVRVA